MRYNFDKSPAAFSLRLLATVLTNKNVSGQSAAHPIDYGKDSTSHFCPVFELTVCRVMFGKNTITPPFVCK